MPGILVPDEADERLQPVALLIGNEGLQNLRDARAGTLRQILVRVDEEPREQKARADNQDQARSRNDLSLEAR